MVSIEEINNEKMADTTTKDLGPPIPVTLLSGFLGSGKTTLLKHILQSDSHNLKIAVIVNDMAELNIDAEYIIQDQKEEEKKSEETGEAKNINHIIQAKREVVKLQNGCICCTLRGDLIREIANIRELGQDGSGDKYDYVLIESTGIAEPQQVAESFCFDPNTNQLAQSDKDRLWTQARLDTCVTVVDAHLVGTHFASLEQFGDKFTDGLDTTSEEGKKEGTKSISILMMEQVEFANVILLNKTDLVSKEELAKAEHIISSLNPKAMIIPCQHGKVDLSKILNTHQFSMEAAARSPGWLESLRGENAVTHSEADEYGVTSFVYRSRKPFSAVKLAKFLDEIMHFAHEWQKLPQEKRTASGDAKYHFMKEQYGNILRAKGFCWLAGKDSFMFGIAMSGRIGSLAGIMPWYTLIPEAQWGVEEGSADYDLIKSKFEGRHGDRRQEIVFIGTDLKVYNIGKALDACCLTNAELKKYKFYTDDGFN